MTATQAGDAVQRLPKAELHCHFEGSIPLETLQLIARRNRIDLPGADRVYDFTNPEDGFEADLRRIPAWVFEALARKYQRPIDDPEKLYGLALYESFLSRFDRICSVLRRPEDYREAVYDSLVRAAEVSNVRYREMYFHPMNNPHVTYQSMVAGLSAGIADAERDAGVVGRLLPSMNRDHSAAAGLELARTVVRDRRPEVVGLASDYDEEHLPAFAEAYRLAAEAGLPGTAHAGEYGSARTVRECIDVLGCRRVDHGYSVIDDPALVERAREEEVHFAAVFSWSVAIQQPERWPLEPPGSLGLGEIDSPVKRMLEAGLQVSLNSDDPAFSGFGDLVTEYRWAAESCGLAVDDLAHIALSAVDASMLPSDEKASLRTSFQAETAEVLRSA